MRLPPEYSTVLSLCLSPDGSKLVSAEEHGTLAVFDLVKVLDKSNTKNKLVKALNVGHPVLSMTSTENELILGSSGLVSAFKWSELSSSSKKPKASWSVVLETKKGSPFETDANDVAVRPDIGPAGQLVVGGGDGRLHCFDIETSMAMGKPVEAHSDYIHSLSYCKDSRIMATASEDGGVSLWASSSWKETHSLKPNTLEELNRPSMGKWVGAVSIKAGFMALGGGVRASIWHPEMLRHPSHVLPPESAAVHSINMQDEHVVIGGAINKLYRTNLMGEPLSETGVSSNCVYASVCQEKPYKVLAVAGASNVIDICAPNFAYGDISMSMPVLN